MSTRTMHCPLCQWTHVEQLPTIPAGVVLTPGDAGPVAEALAKQHATTLEAKLQGHLSEHGTVEWLRLAVRQNGEIARLLDGAQQIERLFGTERADMIDGVTKIMLAPYRSMDRVDNRIPQPERH